MQAEVDGLLDLHRNVGRVWERSCKCVVEEWHECLLDPVICYVMLAHSHAGRMRCCIRELLEC